MVVAVVVSAYALFISIFAVVSWVSDSSNASSSTPSYLFGGKNDAHFANRKTTHLKCCNLQPWFGFRMKHVILKSCTSHIFPQMFFFSLNIPINVFIASSLFEKVKIEKKKKDTHVGINPQTTRAPKSNM